jgi:7,8-dihydroneopterin aldolase/epimerase/oxygenase
MQKIELVGQREYAYHGCLEEESVIGSEYVIDLIVFADLKTSAKTDQLEDTVDYVSLRKIITREMSKRSKLLETVCHRIVSKIFDDFPSVLKLEVKVCKLNPPIDGDVQAVCVSFSSEKS